MERERRRAWPQRGIATRSGRRATDWSPCQPRSQRHGRPVTSHRPTRRCPSGGRASTVRRVADPIEAFGPIEVHRGDNHGAAVGRAWSPRRPAEASDTPLCHL